MSTHRNALGQPSVTVTWVERPCGHPARDRDDRERPCPYCADARESYALHQMLELDAFEDELFDGL